MERYKYYRILLLAVFTVLLAGSVTSAWDIKTLNEPHNRFEASNMTENVKIVELVDSGDEPVDDYTLKNEENTDLYYKYNASSDERVSMNHLYSGYYYASFPVNYTKGLEVKYELFDSSADEGVITNETQVMNPGNMSVELDSVEGDENFFSQRVKAAEEDLLFEVNVTDTVNDTSEDSADVDLYFTNITGTSEVYDLENYEDGLYYNSKIDLPEGTDSQYVLHINVSANGVGYENSFGATSKLFQTYPAIDGHISYLNASQGCNNQSFFAECERGTEISTGFNITESSAENVNLTLNLWNSSGSEWENHTTKRMSYANKIYSSDITVPDINTSIYGKRFQLVYNATNDKRKKVVKRNFSYRAFDIGWRGDSKTALGSYDVELSLSKYFTPTSLTYPRLNGTIRLNNPSGETVESFSLDEMEYRDETGIHVKTIDIPSGSETGAYTMRTEIENIYGDSKTLAENLNVTDVVQTFEVNDGDDLEKEIERTGNYTYNISIENMVSTSHNLTFEYDEGAENFTEVDVDENITLEGGESRNISITFDISRVDDYEGEIRFIDTESEYNETVDIGITSPVCEHRDGTVCVNGGLNVSADSRGNVVKTLEVRNLGHKDRNKTFTIESSGNISEHMDTEFSTLEFNATGFENSTSEKTTLINYSVQAPGYFNGSVTVSDDDGDSVTIPVSLRSDVEATDVSVVVTSSIDLGSLPEGGEKTKDITIENTGDLEVEVTGYSSESLEVSAEQVAVKPGEEETVSVTFSDVTGPGELVLSFESTTEEMSESITVEANTVPDYTEQAQELRQDAVRLDRQISSDSSLQTELNDVQNRIEQIETAYNEENYDEAETTYNEVSRSLDSIEQRATSATDPSNPNPDPEPGTDSGGGGGFLPLVAAIFVIILIGFVLATSVEPEPGDPLYDLLGEN